MLRSSLILCCLGACLALAACAAPPASAPRTATTAAAPFVPEVRDDALDRAARAAPVAFLDRIGWGADAAQLDELARLGATGLLRGQLHPPVDAPLAPAAAARMADLLDVDRPLEDWIPDLVQQQRALRDARGDAAALEQRRKDFEARRNACIEQAQAQQLLLALYAPDQLRQRMVWFWMNHFNVFRGSGMVGPMLADYTQHVIAPHALGHFRDLLAATVYSPQMLIYLNNEQNARGHLNENYARELMELHTMGVGSGYTQADVTHLAQVLSGLGVAPGGRELPPRAQGWQRGLVVFAAARHDASTVQVLGATLGSRDSSSIDQAIDLLAAQPATARHLSRQLAAYFVADDPPPALVDAMVATWARSDGDIAAVLETMFESPQFAASLSQPRFKDPLRYVLSALRVSAEGRVIENPRPLLGMLDKLGEPLGGHQTPDGYPTASMAWNSSGQLTTRFEVARQIGAGAPALFAAADAAPPRQVPALAQGAVFRAAQPRLSPATRDALAQAHGAVEWNTLWLASPEFMQD
jgi:uncharacterized protein (DUF1800 family)